MYRGATTIGLLVEALSALRPEGGLEIVLVNDGSPDASDAACRALLANATVPITYIEHARNYGEHNAVMTGLRHAHGDYVITMDDDLQNPPAEVVRLYDHARHGGWDVVYTRYASKQHAPWRNLGSRFANKVADWLLDKPKGLYLSSFRCMSAMVVRAVARYRGPYPYIDGLIMQVTQRIDGIEVRHLPRAEGRSNYTLKRLVRLWLNLATSFSLIPLRLAVFAGAAMAAVGTVGAVAVIAEALFWHENSVRLGLDDDRHPAGFRCAVADPRHPWRVCRTHVPVGERQAAGNGAPGRTQQEARPTGGRLIAFWLALALAIGTSMAGQTLLKAGAAEADFIAQLVDWRTILGLGLYGGAALLYIVALRRIPMSVALPCTAISYVAAALIGHFGFAEPLGAPHVAALALISAGVMLLALA